MKKTGKRLNIRETIAVVLIIAATVLAIEIQYIAGKLATPDNWVYLGTVHWPSDYFYYLSQMAQGKYSFLYSTMLFTPERLQPVLVGWQNVLTGKILLSLGLDTIFGYQVAVGIYLSLFLFLSYKLLNEIFPESFGRRILALLFFVTSTSMFKLVNSGGVRQLTYHTHWYNMGSSYSRFSPVPHHLIAYCLGTFILLITIYWVKNDFRKYWQTAALFLAGFLLSSVNPVAWGLTSLCLFTAGWVYGFAKEVKGGEKQNKILKLLRINNLRLLVPGIALFSSGILPAIYVRAVFSSSVYSLSSAWESSQQLKMTPLVLFYDSGLIVIFAVFGLFAYFKKPSFAKTVLFTFLAWAVFFYLSGLPGKVRISNARFWPSTVYIGWATLATFGVFYLSERVRKVKEIILAILLTVYVLSVVPTYYALYKEILTPKLNNGYYYITSDVYRAIEKAEEISERDAVFLVQWPFNESFPGLTGRKTMFGFELFTIDFAEKMRLAFEIIDEKMSEDDLYNTLKRYGVDYLLMYSWSPYFKQFSFLKEVYSNPTITIYKTEL